jgi:hypothetical protein
MQFGSWVNMLDLCAVGYKIDIIAKLKHFTTTDCRYGTYYCRI